MLRSMTGFGRSVREDGEWTQVWEVRSVNGRFLDLKWRLPAMARGLEVRFERTVKKFAVRGRVEIALDLTRVGGAVDVRLDETRADTMLTALEHLAALRGEAFRPDYNAFLGMPDLWAVPDEVDNDELEAVLTEGLAAALEDWNESRATEGKALAQDLTARVIRMDEWVGHIAERAPQIKLERTDTLRSRLNQLLAGLSGEMAVEISEGRFLQEVVILADRLDVTEELTRLATHLERMRDLLSGDDDVGKRLDFTLQECFREINTCGNKIQDAMLSRMVVDFKNELEKCREQVQNLE